MFKGFLLKEIEPTFSEGQSPTLKSCYAHDFLA